MTEFLGGVPLGRGGESRRETEVPGIGMLSDAIIRKHGVEHYNENTDTTFYDYKWDDPDTYGKYYWLEQTSLPGAGNVHNYSLQVYTGDDVAEWYRFQTYDAHATPCDTDGRIVPTTYHQMLEGGRRARNYLRLAMAGVSIPLAPLAPPDQSPMKVELTDAENDAFIHIAGCYALEVPGGPSLVLARIYNLPPSGITERDAEKLANYLRKRRPLPGRHDPWPETISYLQLPEEWIPGAVRRALYDCEPSLEPVDIPTREL